MDVQIDAFGDSINKYGEELCGNRVEIIRSEAGVTAILADGMGNGAKANMLASIAVKMTSAMISRGEPIEDFADMIVDSQPAGKQDGVGYSAFTLVQVIFSGTIYIAQMEMPDVILLHHGKPAHINMSKKMKQGKIIRTGVMSFKTADTVIAVSNGVLNAAGERKIESGWHLKNITAFMMNAYHSKISAEKLTQLLLTASNSLSNNKPEDDLSVLTFRMST